MPREDRRIHFSHDEVYKAIYALSHQKQLKLPPAGHVTAITEENGTLFLDLSNPQIQTSAKLDYSRDFVAAALMLMCKGAGIPLPKSAKKSVMLVDGEIILRVQMG
jgi:hypothetical protein